MDLNSEAAQKVARAIQAGGGDALR